MISIQFSEDPKIRRAEKIFLWTVLGVTVAVVFVLVFGYLVQLLWNATLAEMFGFPAISFWQAIGLFVLAKLFFGFGTGGYYGSRYGIGYGGYGYPYYHSPFYWPYNYAYYNDYYSRYYDQDYSDVFTRALVPGIIRPNARLSGFVFFKKLPPQIKTFELR